MHVCHSLHVQQPLYANISLVPSGEHIGNSGAAVALSCLRRSALSYEGRKISALLAQNFQQRPPVFLHVFGRAPDGL